MTELNKAIMHIVAACGMTDAALTKRTGISQQSIGKYRSGEVRPTLERAISLLTIAYKTKANHKDIPEDVKYKSIGDMLFGEERQ